jgi:hypothetical protein
MAYRTSSSDTAFGIVGFLYILLIIAAVIGWVWNIVKIVGSISDPLTAMFIARCVGAFVAPIGAILGYL